MAKKIKVNWQGLEDDIDISEYEGFVYMITNNLNDRKYIGRKYFHSKVRKKVSGRVNRKLVVTESDWSYYTSSSEELNQQIAELGVDNFSFVVISVHKTRGEVNYHEIKEQFSRDVLRSLLPSGEREYYNKNIMSRYFVPKDIGTQEYEDRCASISRALKEVSSKEGFVHPMQGKVHPNKGKKLPQTGHKKILGRTRYTDGVRNILVPPDGDVPDGFVRGITRKCPNKARGETRMREYNLNPKLCSVCGSIMEYKRRNTQGCSTGCSNKLIYLNRSDNSGVKNPMWKTGYYTPLGFYPTAKEAAVANSCSDVTVRNRARSTLAKWSDWFEANDREA